MESGTVAVVLGTRPEVVKLAPLISALGPAARVIRTGQHLGRAMFDGFVRELGVPDSGEHLGVGFQSRGSQLGAAAQALDRAFRDERPRVVVVQGDTTSALAGALAANANDIPLVHVEAGLRSFDRRMPEEHNRRVIDCLADLCCAPTAVNRRNLVDEGVPDERIALTGSTVVDAVLGALPGPAHRADLLARHGLRECAFVLATLHRPENVDDRETLATVLRHLGGLPLPVLLPLHPRTRRRIEEFGLSDLAEPLRVTQPLDYPEMLAIVHGAALVVSDSGGLQEEVTVLRRPIVVVRRSTERPEILGTFGTLVAPGPELEPTLRDWTATAADRRARLSTTASPYGDGRAGRRIAALIRDRHGVQANHDLAEVIP